MMNNTSNVVCDAVNWQIGLLNFDKQDAKILKTCVSNYTQIDAEDRMSTRIKHFVNQICNSIKSFFGQSDWQKAERAVAKHIYSYVPTYCRTFVMKNTQPYVQNLAGRSIKFLVWQNQNKLHIPEYAKILVSSQLQSLQLRAGFVGLHLFSHCFKQGMNATNFLHRTSSGVNGPARSFTETRMNGNEGIFQSLALIARTIGGTSKGHRNSSWALIGQAANRSLNSTCSIPRQLLLTNG